MGFAKSIGYDRTLAHGEDYDFLLRDRFQDHDGERAALRAQYIDRPLEEMQWHRSPFVEELGL